MITIVIKYEDGAQPLEKIPQGDWVDLRANEDVIMKQFEHRLISLGVSMKIPDGFEAYLLPRSSTYKKFGILQANSMGIIDSSYCGNNDIWKFSALAMRDTIIHKGDRICQFRINKTMEQQFEKIFFVTSTQLTYPDRGGFGSTDILMSSDKDNKKDE